MKRDRRDPHDEMREEAARYGRDHAGPAEDAYTAELFDHSRFDEYHRIPVDVAFNRCEGCGATYRFDLAADQIQCPLCGAVAPEEDE